MTTLKPLSKYIDKKQADVIKGNSNGNTLNEIFEHNTWFKTPLSLGQFIATDKDGKPLEKPWKYDEWINKNQYPGFSNFIPCKEYQESVSQIIFEGWEPAKLDSRLVKNNGMAIRFTENGIFLGLFLNKPKLTTIESISHLNLELVDGKENLL